MIRRLFGYLVDYLSISLPLMIICMMLGSLPMFDTNGDFPFQMITFVYMPHIFWPNLIRYPNHYGSLSWLPWIIAAAIFFECIVYSLQEYLGDRTLGEKLMGLKIVRPPQARFVLFNIVFRNLMKVTSKYLLGIPFIVIVFSRENKTLYDKLSNITVVQTAN